MRITSGLECVAGANTVHPRLSINSRGVGIGVEQIRVTDSVKIIGQVCSIYSSETGALLLTMIGGANIVGSILSGYICDRLGAAQTLGLAGLGFALGWGIIGTTDWLPAMSVAMLLIGVSGSAAFPPLSVLITQVYGVAAMARVFVLIGILMLPFTFIMPPVAGWLRDLSGNYASVMAALVFGCSVVGLIFFLMSRFTRGGVDKPKLVPVDH